MVLPTGPRVWPFHPTTLSGETLASLHDKLLLILKGPVSKSPPLRSLP